MLPETAEIFRKKLRADSSLGDNLLRTDSPYKWLKGNESVELIRRIEAEAKARDWNDEEWKIRLALGALDGGLYGVTADAINLKRGELFERYKTIIEVAIKDKSSQLGRLVGVFFEQEIKKDREERKKALDAYPGEKVGNVFVATSAAGLQRFINSHPVLNRGGTLTERGAKNVLALLAAIGGAEVEGFEGPEGYNIIQGGSSFDPYNTPGHPGIAGPASDAAGKYQFISPTWNGNSSAVAPLLGLPSSQVPMTPQNQDAFAIYLAMAVRGVTVDDFNNSNFEVINQKLVDEWAVLQHGGVGSYDKDGVNQSSVSSEDVAARAAAM
jgi:muramidase (phage lysozyme)